jgi:hypothetical protein
VLGAPFARCGLCVCGVHQLARQKTEADVRLVGSRPGHLANYAHVQLADQTRALATLPSLDAPRANVAAPWHGSPKAGRLAATGT